MYTVGGYSVLGWNHPGFGGSTVSSVGRFFCLFFFVFFIIK